jgi:PIN domain nuclease of toxin-antitoxin system
MLHQEPGGESVARLLDRAAISAVNWSEVVQHAEAHGVDTAGLRADLQDLGLTIVAFGAHEAEQSAALWPATRLVGLGLGDRACLALARALQLPAFTADRAWSRLRVGVRVRLVR